MYGWELGDFEDGKTPNRYLYRGNAQAGEQDIHRAQNLATGMANRDAPLANYGQADQSRGLGMQARADQARAVDIYRNAALGRGPSAAQAQMQSGLDQSMRAQQSMAASARGGGMARAAARSEAMANASDQGARGASMAAALRAQEMQSAMQGYAGAAGQLRGADLAGQGQDAQQAQFQAGMQMQNRGMNDQASFNYEKLAQQTAAMDQQGNTNAEERYQQSKQADLARDDEMRNRNADRNVKVAMGVANGITSMMGMASDERVKRDVKPADGNVRSFLDALAAHAYAYKEPAKNGGGRHVSPMAQELEKAGPVGRGMVEDTPGGKMVDYAKGFGAMLAAQASLNKRLEKLEGTFPARKRAA